MVLKKVYHADGVEIVLNGVVTTKDLLSLSAEIYSHPSMSQFKYQLWHMDDIEDMMISAHQMYEVARQDMDAAAIFPNMKVAIISNSLLVYGMGRMYEAYCDGGRWETMVFKDIDEAWKWVKSDNNHL